LQKFKVIDQALHGEKQKSIGQVKRVLISAPLRQLQELFSATPSLLDEGQFENIERRIIDFNSCKLPGLKQ
jgi:hypothetical protein